MAGVGDEDARERDAPALAARDLGALLAHGRVETPREPVEPGAEAGLGQRRADRLVAGVRAPDGHVGPHRRGEEVRLLAGQAHDPAHLVLGGVAEVHAAERDAARVGIAEADEQVGERRLARAAAPDEGDARAGRQHEGGAVEREVPVEAHADALGDERAGGRQRRAARPDRARPARPRRPPRAAPRPRRTPRAAAPPRAAGRRPRRRRAPRRRARRGARRPGRPSRSPARRAPPRPRARRPRRACRPRPRRRPPRRRGAGHEPAVRRRPRRARTSRPRGRRRRAPPLRRRPRRAR